MDITKKDSALCSLAVIISVGCFGIAKLLSMMCTLDRADALLIAMSMTIMMGLVLFLVNKINNPALGILAGLVGYKMLPPNISAIGEHSVYGDMLYFLVGKFAVLVFILLLLKHYRNQEKPVEIKAVPILAAMLAVPFFNEISTYSYSFFVIKTGSLMGYYFCQFGCYAIATMIIVFLAARSGYSTLRLITIFEFVALTINVLKRAAVIIYYQYMGYHVSKGYYCWIVVYVGLAVITLAAFKLKQREARE